MKIIALCSLVALLGCKTIQPQEFNVATKIYCDTEQNISEQYYKLRPLPQNTFGNLIYGYNWIDGVHVRWSENTDKNGEPMPDFDVLGHEIWHRIKGDYHK